jgi:hypothetical protein
MRTRQESDLSDARMLFPLELIIAKVLELLPRLRSFSVEVSIHENRHRALAWIYPKDAHFRLLPSQLPSGLSLFPSFVLPFHVYV